jgi:serine/threonine-protein kinase
VTGRALGNDTEFANRIQMGQVIDGRYEICAPLGIGGHAIVFEATDTVTGQLVAIKMLRGEGVRSRAVESLCREAKLVGSLGHPNICAVHATGWLGDGTPYLVLERLEGETAEARARRDSMMDTELALEIMIQVMAGLAVAHERGIIHRDITPNNIFLTKEAGVHVKLLDFGVAREMSETSEEGRGFMVGTPAYMAPEQILDQPLDARADLYSAGAVLFRLLTGQPPFVANTPKELFPLVLNKKAARLRNLRASLPPVFDEIQDGTLARDPQQRYASANALQGALFTAKEDLYSETFSTVAPINPVAALSDSTDD